MQRKPKFNGMIIVVLLALSVLALNLWSLMNTSTTTMSYSRVLSYFQSQQVVGFEMDLNTGDIKLALVEGDVELPSNAVDTGKQPATRGQLTQGGMFDLIRSQSQSATGAKETVDRLPSGEGIWQVEMGTAEFEPALVPVKGLGSDPVINRAIAVEGLPWQVTALSMGNPHCVTVVEDVQGLDLERIGPGFENHPAFPEHVNTEFIQVMGKNHLAMRVWERGSGETLACGTGACASAAAAVMLRLCEPDTDIALDLPGGRLTIRVSEDWQIRMTGPAKTVYTGVVEV